MIQHQVISQLLESGTRYPQNLDLLKKILVTTQLGRLQINGLPPDDKISLASYLFDSENILFDFTRLSDEKRKVFLHWLLEPHQHDKVKKRFCGVAVNEFRGFTAEALLSWWGSIKNWFNKKYAEYWKITDVNLSLNYQLIGMEIQQGKQGLLVHFDQLLTPLSGTKYCNPEDKQKEALGNTKRVFITDHVVDQLIHKDLELIDFASVCKHPHPHSIKVKDMQERLNQMHDYRRMQRFEAAAPWYERLWRWLWSKEEKNRSASISGTTLTTLLQSKSINIAQYSKTHEILVTERKPEIDNVVFCGGGAKIFAHVGFWKALNEAKIKPEKFAGSSAGAIMALLCYLGYSSDEIAKIFQNFRQEHLIHFDLSVNGISDPRSLKTALDYVIAKKLTQIVSRYNIPYPSGTISFATLDAIRKQCPGCGLGSDLIVTTTNKNTAKTHYYSLHHAPHFEVSEAVKVSASLPRIYHSTTINGEEHVDGGVLTNFPTEVFCEDYSTLLESEYGNNLKVLAVQFDNGTERSAIDRIKTKVYRENFLTSWLYAVITGVRNPVSGWEQDRLKLRKYSSQSVVINVAQISSASFSVAEEVRNKMMQTGYDATINYLNIHYAKTKQLHYEHDELMYTKFNSLGDFLAYCCYRGNKHWFDEGCRLISHPAIVEKNQLYAQAHELKELYFNNSTPMQGAPELQNRPFSFFCKEPVTNFHKILLAAYPVLLKLSPELLRDNNDRKICDNARHFFTLKSPFTCLSHFEKISKPVHIFLYSVIILLKELEKNINLQKRSEVKRDPEQLNKAKAEFDHIISHFEKLRNILKLHVSKYQEKHFAHWNLSYEQTVNILNLFHQQRSAEVDNALSFMPRKPILKSKQSADAFTGLNSATKHVRYSTFG